jgi:hypothetical protein
MRRNQLKRLWWMTVFCLAAFLAAAGPAAGATPDFGVRTGLYPEQEDAFVGAEMLFGVGTDRRWFGNPNVEHVLRDGGDLTTFSFDFHYDFHGGAPYTLWAGAGPTLIHRDTARPGDDDTTDAGVNLLFGVGARQGDVRPYGQVKLVVAEDDNLAVFGVGARF